MLLQHAEFFSTLCFSNLQHRLLINANVYYSWLTDCSYVSGEAFLKYRCVKNGQAAIICFSLGTFCDDSLFFFFSCPHILACVEHRMYAYVLLSFLDIFFVFLSNYFPFYTIKFLNKDTGYKQLIYTKVGLLKSYCLK